MYKRQRKYISYDDAQNQKYFEHNYLGTDSIDKTKRTSIKNTIGIALDVYKRQVLATEVENMIVSSADLSNSDKTDGFLKKKHAFTNDDFTGAFLQAGVSELTMACCCLGMALHEMCIRDSICTWYILQENHSESRWNCHDCRFPNWYDPFAD